MQSIILNVLITRNLFCFCLECCLQSGILFRSFCYCFPTCIYSQCGRMARTIKSYFNNTPERNRLLYGLHRQPFRLKGLTLYLYAKRILKYFDWRGCLRRISPAVFWHTNLQRNYTVCKCIFTILLLQQWS